ncbi:MAG: hypothetical protein ACYSR1_03875 [Planctomycetota bacterium]|jgi:hypothetical protein
MKKFAIMFLCLSTLFFNTVCSVVYGQGSNEDLETKVDNMEKMLMDLKGQLKKQTEATDELKAMRDEISKISAPTAPADDFYWTKKSQEIVDKGLAPVFGKQYGKPFLRRFGRNTYVGGYMDHELIFQESQGGKESKKHTFDQHRLIPFIYSDVSDRVKFAMELEIEHGGPQSPGSLVEGGKPTGDVKIEFATIDFLMTDWLNFRSGIILSPVGKYNLVHDSPLQDLTIRPMVSTNIIPTTLSDAGAGFFGSFYPSELSKLDYELYVSNGFQSIRDDGKTASSSSESFIRSSRGNLSKDNNYNFAILGRLAYSPFLGLEVGGSFHTGYTATTNGNRLTILAADWTYQRGAFEFVGEMAHASFDRDGITPVSADGRPDAPDGERSSVLPGRSFGYYAETRYHFMPQLLKDLAPTFFRDDSTFTAVARLGQINMGSFGYEDGKARRTRITPGFNFRYTEDTVFKAEYQINLENGRELSEVSNNSLVFSVATYF